MVVVDAGITAKTKRLLIRPLRMDDAEVINKLRSNPEVMKHTSMKACDDIEKSRAWIQGCYDRDNCWNFVMELLPTSDAPTDTAASRVIGIMGAVRAPEVGYMLLPEYWGKGYTTEALNAFLELFFEHFSRGENPTHEYAEALTDSEHVVSQHILTKAGFVLHERRENDFENPSLGLRSTVVYRKYRPGSGTELKGKDN